MMTHGQTPRLTVLPSLTLVSMHITAGREVAFRLCGLGVIGFVSFCCCFGLARGEGRLKWD